MLPRLSVALAGFFVSAAAAHAAGDIEWRYRAANGAVSLAANPLTPAQRIAFYLARGFSATAIRPYADACGFSFSMQNGGAGTLSTRLADWRAIGMDSRAVRLRLPAEWDLQWDKAQVPEAARIAFRWAQFQTENTFEAGDWIMGMATLESPLQGGFRLIARYQDDKGQHEVTLNQLFCAGD
ncbi:MAG: hypothetical protein WCV99_07600 [Sterolibacterium sp.]|jgi:hypothetical protein